MQTPSKADTLQSFIADLKKHIEKQPGAAISVTLLTHRQGDEEILFFGREAILLSDAIAQLSPILNGKNVIFHALSCCLASSRLATKFQDSAQLALLTAPSSHIGVAPACHFQTHLINFRCKGFNSLDAIEAARLEIMKEMRQHLMKPGQPILPSYLQLPVELPQTHVVLPIRNPKQAA